MKILSLLLVFLIALGKSYSQDYDLIVKSSGDSIACHIDSITVTHIYFEMMSSNHWIHTFIERANVNEFQHDAINAKQVVFKSGTSIIEEGRDLRESMLKIHRNYIIGNINIVASNINYERNLFRTPAFLANIRLGYGIINDLQGGGNVYSAAMVGLIGQKNSHFELDLGIIAYKAFKTNFNPSSSGVMTDGFIGYRYEKPNGIFVFRTGFIYPSIYSLTLGAGFKF